jgi:hypothetical protein
VAWLPGSLQHPFLRLNKCVVPGLGAWTFAFRRQRSHVRVVSGAPTFSLFYNAICAPELKLQFCLIQASDLEKSPASADSSATDDVGQKLEQLLLRSAFAVIAGSLFDCLPDTVSLPKSRGHGHDQCAWSRGQSDTCPAPDRILDRTSLLATVHIGKPYRDSNCVAERIWSRPPVSLLNSG